MKIRAAVATMALLPIASLALAAGPADADCVDLGGGALACTETGWLACESTVPKVHLLSVDDAVGLTDEEPTTSFTAGAGCGTTEVAGEAGTNIENVYDLVTNGRFDTNVDRITVELHAIDVAAHRATGDPLVLEVRATVDNTSMSGYVEALNRLQEVVTTERRFTVEVQPVVSATGLSESFVFTLDNILDTFPDLVDDGDRQRSTVAVTVGIPQRDYAGVWVWGASEVPANITVNGEALGTVVDVATLQPAG